MNILVIGAGMYVTGREGSGTGTVLASIAEYSRRQLGLGVTVAARSAENEPHVSEAARRINALLGTNLAVKFERLTAERTLAHLLCTQSYDCAVVSVPDHAHFEVTRVLLEANVPALVVKPLTPTLAEARALVDLMHEKRCYGAVEFHKRFDETNLYARRTLADGLLGQLLYVTVDYSQRITIPTVTFREWAGRTNIFQYLGVHYVDLIHFLTGFLPHRVMALGTHGTLRERGVTEFDSVHATIVWRSADRTQKLVSQFATNWIDCTHSSALSDQKYKIVGTKGRLELDQKDRGVELVTQEKGIQQINPYFSEFLPDMDRRVAFSGYGPRSIERFLNDVRDLQNASTTLEVLENSRPSFRSALASVAVTEAVNASLANDSAWEEIDEVF